MVKREKRPATSVIGVRLTREERSELEVKAKKLGYSISEYIRYLIEKKGGKAS